MKRYARPRILSWLWDLKYWFDDEIRYKVEDWWEDFIKPKELLTEQYIPYPSASTYLFHYRLHAEGVSKIDAIDIEKAIYHKRSWLLPWRKYHYVALSEPRSDYTILYCSAAFIGEGNRVMSADECCRIMEDTLNRAHRTPDAWWPPTGLDHR